MSFKYIGLIVSDSISLSLFFRLVLCIFPGVCGIILPVCFLISSIIAMHAMQNNKEIVAFMTAGQTPLFLLNPLMFLAGIIMVVVLYIQTTGSPSAYRAFESLKEQIKTQISVNLLKPKTFNVVGSSVIYVGKKKGNELTNLFVSYTPQKKNSTNIITAKIGAFIVEENKAFIRLQDGYVQEIDVNNNILSSLKFERLAYDVSSVFKRFYEKASRIVYKTQAELIEEIRKSTDEGYRRNCLAEYHSRLTTPFLLIFNALIIGLFMLRSNERGKGRLSVAVAFFSGIFCHVAIMSLINYTTKNSSLILYNYIIVASLLAGLFTLFVKRINQ